MSLFNELRAIQIKKFPRVPFIRIYVPDPSPCGLPELGLAQPPDPATGKDIAQIWFSEKEMSTLAALAPGRLSAAARRSPQACRARSRQQGAGGGQKPIIGPPSSIGWRTTSAPPGREIPRSSRRCGPTAESH